MGPDVLRRKLQKKSKRKRYARCSKCGGWATCRLSRRREEVPLVLTKACRDCGHTMTQTDLSGWVAEQADA